jgi:poly(3-hydroxybutyrate) depolymerase
MAVDGMSNGNNMSRDVFAMCDWTALAGLSGSNGGCFSWYDVHGTPTSCPERCFSVIVFAGLSVCITLHPQSHGPYVLPPFSVMMWSDTSGSTGNSMVSKQKSPPRPSTLTVLDSLSRSTDLPCLGFV